MAEIPEIAKYGLDKELYKYFAVEIVMCMNYGFKVIGSYTAAEDCPICYETMQNKNVIIPRCGNHKFHYECLMPTICDYRMLFCPECSTKPETEKVKYYKYGKDLNLTYPVPVKNVSQSNTTTTYTPSSTTTHTPTHTITTYLSNFQSANNQVYENYYENNPSNTALIPYEQPPQVPALTVSQYTSDDERSAIYQSKEKFYNENCWQDYNKMYI